MRKGWNYGLLSAFTVLTLLIAAGCDDEPRSITPPPVAPEYEAQITAADDPPQEPELSGERHELHLQTLPLTMKAPTEWTIDRSDRVSLLKGPTPNGSITIQLIQKPPATESEMRGVVAVATGESEFSSPSDDATFTTKGQMHLLERQHAEDTTPIDELQESHDEPSEDTFEEMVWRLTVYVRRGETYEVYELDFFDLSRELFEQDRAFLEEILATIELADRGSAGGEDMATSN